MKATCHPVDSKAERSKRTQARERKMRWEDEKPAKGS